MTTRKSHQNRQQFAIKLRKSQPNRIKTAAKTERKITQSKTGQKNHKRWKVNLTRFFLVTHLKGYVKHET